MDPSSLTRTSSNLSTASSQTAQDYIATQLSLEADAREALPYQFDTCTYPLGPLRQSVYACLTCTPPPASIHQQFTPAGVCYSCSISCHGEHDLVELFSKRDFVCDCGTTRLDNSGTGCSLRHNAATGRKGGVMGERAREDNKYNQNYEGKFCGCGEEYDPEKEKGTMFQCLGLGTVEDGGCGEDWWHPECLLGLPRIKNEENSKVEKTDGDLGTVKEEAEDGTVEAATNGATEGSHDVHSEIPLPDGFPGEDDFDHLICYKCVNAFPWIRAYANSPGFLTAKQPPTNGVHETKGPKGSNGTAIEPSPVQSESTTSLKRKADDSADDSQETKKARSSPTEALHPTDGTTSQPKHTLLPPVPSTPTNLTLFLTEDFRNHLCRCAACFPTLSKHPQLLEEEASYEPPLSASSEQNDDVRSIHSVHSGGSLLERGEAALSSMDRVKAIEGVMAYNHVRDKVKDFLKPFAESGVAVGAEDIKEYFAKLRGDEMAERQRLVNGESGVRGDGRREQGGY